MSEPTSNDLSRRDMLATTGKLAAAGALAGISIPAVHAAGDDLIRVVLIGCGGRGTGAAENALSTKGPTQLYAMVDVFQDRLDGSYKYLSGNKNVGKKVDVPKQRKYLGFDGYKEAMDGMKPGDVVISTTPPAFRWLHYQYAISKGLNVFLEKPVTVDGPSSRKMLELNKKALEKNLKVGVGLMCRHCENRQQLKEKIEKGDLGDILTMRAYRMHGPIGYAHVAKKPEKERDLLYQIRNFHAFLWASGGCYSDFLIHNIDECCWMKGSWPVEARASGGRHYRVRNGVEQVDQNFDSYSVEYTFDDGTKLFLEGRTIDGCQNEFASYLHGTKGSAVISRSNHGSGRCPVFKGQKIPPARARLDEKKHDIVWMGKRDEPSPYQVEWDVLIDAIRNDKKHNECQRGVEASLVTAMGRMAAHTGQVVTFKEMLANEHEFAPELEKFSFTADAPVRADQEGRYPVPEPGKKKREY